MDSIISNKNLNTSALVAKRKTIFYSLYNYCIKNRNLETEMFFDGLNKTLNRNLEYEKLLKFIGFSKKYISSDKACIVESIVKNKKSGKNEDIVIKEIKKSVGFLQSSYSADKHVKSMEEINLYMDECIEAKKKGEPISKSKYDLTKIKTHIKEFDEDKIIDFFIAFFDLKTIDKKEMEELIEVVNFFINNLQNSKEYLTSLDPIDNKEEVNEFYVDGQDELNDFIKKNPKRYYNWKVTRVDKFLKMYLLFIGSIEKFSEDYNIESIKRLSTDVLAFIKEDNVEVYNVYEELINLYIIYNVHINGIKTVKDSKIDSIKEKFVKKLVLENNIEQ